LDDILENRDRQKVLRDFNRKYSSYHLTINAYIHYLIKSLMDLVSNAT